MGHEAGPDTELGTHTHIYIKDTAWAFVREIKDWILTKMET